MKNHKVTSPSPHPVDKTTKSKNHREASPAARGEDYSFQRKISEESGKGKSAGFSASRKNVFPALFVGHTDSRGGIEAGSVAWRNVWVVKPAGILSCMFHGQPRNRYFYCRWRLVTMSTFPVSVRLSRLWAVHRVARSRAPCLNLSRFLASCRLE